MANIEKNATYIYYLKLIVNGKEELNHKISSKIKLELFEHPINKNTSYKLEFNCISFGKVQLSEYELDKKREGIHYHEESWEDHHFKKDEVKCKNCGLIYSHEEAQTLLHTICCCPSCACKECSKIEK